MTTKIKVHRDGTATYWSVFELTWHHHIPLDGIPDRVLATMSDVDRALAHKARQRWLTFWLTAERTLPKTTERQELANDAT